VHPARRGDDRIRLAAGFCALGVSLAGGAIERRGKRGELVGDVLLLVSAHHETIPFGIASALADKEWLSVLDTARAANPFEERRVTDEYPPQGDRWYCSRNRRATLEKPELQAAPRARPAGRSERSARGRFWSMPVVTCAELFCLTLGLVASQAVSLL
jgi:hypothetical protein